MRDVGAYGVVVAADLVGADARCQDSPQLQSALAEVEKCATEATRLEATGVTRADIDRLAFVGVLSAGVTDEWTPSQARELQERLAAASGALWFVMTQHRSPAVAAQETRNRALRERYAQPLATGSMLGAVSFAHLRRPRPSVVAKRVDGGWQVSGQLDWITSWGLADVLLLMAETDDGQVVQMLFPASERAGLTIVGELSLAAMQGTSTVGAILEDLRVPDSEVAHVLAKRDWLAADGQRSGNVPPAVVGLARAALNSLLAAAAQRRWPEAAGLAKRWRKQLVGLRARAYYLADEVEAAESLGERLEIRGALTRLAQDITSMAVAAQGGRAMVMSSPEQRWAREALFSLVQAQTLATRNALIASYLGPATD